jgi:hydrogenase maturation protease
MSAPAALVIGFGNRRRGDDAAGPLALELLRGMALHGVTLEEFDGDGMALLDRWCGIDSVVVIDAVQSGRRPGEVIALSSEQIEDANSFRSASTHGLGLMEAVRLGRTLGLLPHRLWIVGVEGVCFEVGTEASQAVRRGAREAARLVAERWGA